MNTESQANNSFKIESGIPFPSGPSYRSAKYPFRDMKVGDSFFANGIERSKVQTASSYFAIRNPEYKFSVRREGDGFRVWRIEVAA